ncbi:hypothetical protein KEM48_011786, partial [Puccinia striiformis f. sp. tritici PST-130]
MRIYRWTNRDEIRRKLRDLNRESSVPALLVCVVIIRDFISKQSPPDRTAIGV